MSIKIAMVGAGSIVFTRRLMRDILSVPELRDSTFALTDISEYNLSMVSQLCQKDIQSSGVPAKLVSTLDRRSAIADSDYVISTIRQGGLDAFQLDIDIPLKYGVDQCVGDTLCAGGIMYAQRGISALLDFCRDIREVAAPDCLLLNYANPMAMMTWAVNKYGGVRCVGLCHGVQHGHFQIAEALGKKKSEVDIICAGINHQTWFISVKTDGKERTADLLAAFERHPIYRREEK